MYFFIFIILIFILIPITIEYKYTWIIYLKIFISSTLYFYLLNTERLLLTLLLTVLAFMIISILIYRLLKSKMEFKEDDNTFFNLAHEVKNPLAVCKGYLDMIDTNDKDKMERYTPIIKSEMNRSITIIDEFLDLKRIKLNKEIMDFSLLLEDIKSTIELVYNISFNIPNTDKEIIMDGDYDKLKQVLVNLIKNSYEAEAKNIKTDIRIKNNSLIVKIIDDGKGIIKEDLNKIGEVFYTTKDTGTGIGVSISKEIIKLHHGSLSYESIPNKGTTAIMELPIKYIF